MSPPHPLDDAPSAAAASEAGLDCGGEPCPQPVTAIGAGEDARHLAEGLRMRANPAEWAYVRLLRLIADFESRLDPGEEMAVRLVGLPGDGTMQIDDIGFWGPDLILLMGRNVHGKPVRLVQHYNQLNVALSAVPKPEEREQARRIGFQLMQNEGADAS